MVKRTRGIMHLRPNFWVVLIVGASLMAGAPGLRAADRPMADRLIVADHVVTMNPDMAVWEPGAVAIRGGSIVAVGEPETVRRQVRARRTEQMGNRWIMPGLVNLHAHIAMTPMRGVADDMELMTWLRRYIFPLEARLVNARFVYEASLLGCAEMISRGTTTVVDMYYFEDDVARAVREAGLRGWLGQTIIDFKAPDCDTPAEALQYTEATIRRWQADPLVRVIPAPHSCYTCSPETLRLAGELAVRFNSLLTYHLAESANEEADIRKRYNARPVEHAARMGLLGKGRLAAHCVHLTSADLDLIQSSGTAVAHNPDSNLKLASGIAPIPEIRRRGIPVGLGTDGAASNNRLDLFAAMDLTAKIHKQRENDPTVMPARDVVRMATIEGAAAISADKQIGSLEPGKQADLIVLDLSGPLYEPVHNIYSHLVYVAHGEAVTGTMVAGRWLMKDRRLLTLEPKRLARLAAGLRREIRGITDGQP